MNYRQYKKIIKEKNKLSFETDWFVFILVNPDRWYRLALIFNKCKKQVKYRNRHKKEMLKSIRKSKKTSPQSENKDKEYRGAENLCFAIVK